MEAIIFDAPVADVIPIRPAESNSALEAVRALNIATTALVEIALIPGPGGERAMQGLRDIKGAIIDG
jgi:hypothetical protein